MKTAAKKAKRLERELERVRRRRELTRGLLAWHRAEVNRLKQGEWRDTARITGLLRVLNRAAYPVDDEDLSE